MAKPIMFGIGILAILVIVGVLIFSNQNTNDTNNNNNQPTPTTETTVVEEESGPIAFSKVGKNIMDANKEYKFTFENGEGSCMNQNFPTDLVYGPGNVVKTEDGKYTEDMTSADFMGNVRFDEVPLSTGSASCLIKTSTQKDTADLSCSVNDKEVCTATFDLFAHKQ